MLDELEYLLFSLTSVFQHTAIDEDDEELDKWNADDERKQLETQMEELDEIDKSLDRAVSQQLPKRPNYSLDENTTASTRTASSSLDLFPGVHDDDNSQSSNRMSLHLADGTQWDESNTIPSGQGDSFKSRDSTQASTPFSKLLKSGLFGSRRRLSSTDDQPRQQLFNDEVRVQEVASAYLYGTRSFQLPSSVTINNIFIGI